jgi:hypothetical protein
MRLRIMKYRAAMLGATLDVQSAPGRVTTVTCAFGKGLCSATPAKSAVTRGTEWPLGEMSFFPLLLGSAHEMDQ